MSEEETNLADFFEEYTPEEADKDRRFIDSGGDFVKLKVGRNTFRIVPKQKGQEDLFFKVYVHYIRLPGKEEPVVINCAKMMTGGKRQCDVCTKANKLKASSNPLDQNIAKDWYPKARTFCNVIDRKDPEGGIKKWGFGKQIFDQINDLRNDPEDPVDFSHPINGYDLHITRKGTGKNDTEYRVKLAGKPSKLCEDMEDMKDYILNQPDLSVHQQLPSSEDIKKLMRGEAPNSRRQLSSGDEGRTPSRTAADDIDDVSVVDDDDIPFD